MLFWLQYIIVDVQVYKRVLLEQAKLFRPIQKEMIKWIIPQTALDPKYERPSHSLLSEN